jgi:hypothetical protein
MARYKVVDRSPRFLPVVLDAQRKRTATTVWTV